VGVVETDYLVVGAGATGMAFLDTLIHETDAHVVLVDRGHAPGGHWITLQTVRTCQPVFSAAVIAHVEAAYGDDATRNAFCAPVPNPEVPLDWLRMMLTYNRNQLQWFDDPAMMAWLDAARLNILSHATASVSPRAREKITSVMRSRLAVSNDRLEALLASG
jgi:hypothetical protein